MSIRPDDKNKLSDDGPPYETVKLKRFVPCFNCSKLIEDELSFCSYCGAKRATDEAICQNNPKAFEKAPSYCQNMPDQTIDINDNGTELFRHNTAVHLRGLVPASGCFSITESKIFFMPQTMYYFQKPFFLDLNQIAELTYAKMISSRLVIKIITKSGITHRFVLEGLSNNAVINELAERLDQIIAQN